jgi:hypothetical protein
MKKLTLLEAVIFCALTITVLNSCDNDLVTYKTSYSYEVKMDYSASVCYQDEATSAINAFNIAIGTDGYSYKAYETNQDNKMKSACESVKERFSNVNSTYMKFDLYRLTLSADPQTPKKEEIIGTYSMGQALTTPFVTYSFSTNEDEAYAELQAKKDLLNDSLYTTSMRTLRTLLGRHVSSSGTGGTTSSVMYSAFENEFSTILPKVWKENQNDETFLAATCDSIANAHASDALAVKAVVTLSKTGFLNKEVTPIWTKTFNANIE